MGETVWKSLETVLEERFTEQKLRERPPRLKTGFAQLDRLLGGGLAPGLTVLGGSPGMGKSTFALQLSEQVARQGTPVLYVSLEMSRDRIAAKAISRELFRMAEEGLKITADCLTGGGAVRQLTPEQWARIGAARQNQRAAARNLHVIETPLSAAAIAEAAGDFLARTGRAPLVVVDYLQILPSDTPRLRSEKQSVEESLKEMVGLTRQGDHGLPVFLISSLNRSGYGGSIQIDAFKETGGIEYSADVLLGLQFSAGQEKDALRSDGPRPVEIVLLKQRYGSSGDRIPFRYYAAYDCFVEEAPEDGTVLPEAPAAAPRTAPAAPARAAESPAAALPDLPASPPAAPAAREEPAATRVRKGPVYVINNTKVANEIRQGDTGAGGACLVLPSRGGHPEVRTRYTLSQPLTAFDCHVADTVYTLFRRNREDFSPGLVLRTLTGDRRQTLTAQKRRRITGSIQRLRETELQILCTEEMRARKLIGPEEERTLEGPFLSVRQEGERYRFEAPLPLYAYGELARQMITFPGLLLDVPDGNRKLSDTAENIGLKRFLIRRLEIIRNPNNDALITGAMRTVSFQTARGLLAELRVRPGDLQKCRRLRASAVKILEYYVRLGYIGGYETAPAAEGVDGLRITGTIRNPWELP